MFESVDLSFPEHLQQSCPERSLPANQKINNNLFCNQRYFIQKKHFRWISHFIFYRENLPTRNFIKPPSMDSQTTRGMYTISACSNKTTNQKTRGDRNIGKSSLDKQGRWQPTGSRCCTAPPHCGPSCYSDPRKIFCSFRDFIYLQRTWWRYSNSKEKFCLLP